MNRLLLVRLSAMGDLVQSLGAVESLRIALPNAALTFVTQPTWAPLLEGLPGIARVVTFDRGGGVGGLLRLRRELRALDVDVALDLQGNWKSAAVARLSGARRRVGMEARWRQEPGSRALLTEVVRCDATPHPARAAWELAKRIAPGAPFALPHLAPTAAEFERERAALRGVGVDPERPFRVVVGTASHDPRALRPSWLERLVDGPQAVLVTGPAEAGMAWSGDRPRLHHGPGEARRLVALGAAVAAAGGDVVGPDQGASHVLLATGARGRVLFGSQDPRRSAPPAATALQGPVALPCRPCRRSSCHPGAAPRFACMDYGPDEGASVDIGMPSLGEVEPR